MVWPYAPVQGTHHQAAPGAHHGSHTAARWWYFTVTSSDSRTPRRYRSGMR